MYWHYYKFCILLDTFNIIFNHLRNTHQHIVSNHFYRSSNSYLHTFNNQNFLRHHNILMNIHNYFLRIFILQRINKSINLCYHYHFYIKNILLNYKFSKDQHKEVQHNLRLQRFINSIQPNINKIHQLILY